MTETLLVLDVHGVVLNNPLPDFVAQLPAPRGALEPARARWARARRAFWEGRLSEERLWAELAPGADPAELRRALEARYAPGPYHPYLMDSSHRCWLLSNHRQAWLLPRLRRFGLADRFERVLVSDQLGAAKPSYAAFAPVIEAAKSDRVTFVDDNPRNVAAARRLGLCAVLADDQLDWAALSQARCPIG